MDESWDLIFSYTRQQAIDDGVLIDVTDSASETGFAVQVAVTGNLFHSYVTPPPGLESEGQSISGRLHDLLTLARVCAALHGDQDRIHFEVLFLMAPGWRRRVEVVAVIGPGDRGEPVLTIMLPGDE